MGSSPNEHKTATHCIFFLVTCTECMTGLFLSPFIISDTKCITYEAASELVYGGKALSPSDVKSSLEICRGGGMGCAIMVFLIQGASTSITWHFEQYNLLEQLPVGMYCFGWPAIVMSITNGYMSFQDLLRAIASTPQEAQQALLYDDLVEGVRDIMQKWKLDEE